MGKAAYKLMGLVTLNCLRRIFIQGNDTTANRIYADRAQILLFEGVAKNKWYEQVLINCRYVCITTLIWYFRSILNSFLC